MKIEVTPPPPPPPAPSLPSTSGVVKEKDNILEKLNVRRAPAERRKSFESLDQPKRLEPRTLGL